MTTVDGWWCIVNTYHMIHGLCMESVLAVACLERHQLWGQHSLACTLWLVRTRYNLRANKEYRKWGWSRKVVRVHYHTTQNHSTVWGKHMLNKLFQDNVCAHASLIISSPQSEWWPMVSCKLIRIRNLMIKPEWFCDRSSAWQVVPFLLSWLEDIYIHIIRLILI